MRRTIIAVLFCLAAGASLAWAGPSSPVLGPAADSPSDVVDDVILAVWSGPLSFLGKAQASPVLNVGDAAPPLVVSHWVKGEKIEQFEADKIYVIDFWATWCVPCRKSMPHLSELAHRYKDKGVKFIGINVWEWETKRVQPFIDEMGEKMDYCVAMDAVPKTANPNDGAMLTSWMNAAEETGIPCVFVVRDGKIAWIGHPSELDEPLAKIVGGDWDFGSAARKRLVAKMLARRVRNMRGKLLPLYDAGDYKATIARIEETAAIDAELAAEFTWLKFAALCNDGNEERGLAVGCDLLETHKNNPYALNIYFRPVIDLKLKNEPTRRVSRLALVAAQRAVELTNGENSTHLDTLALALFRTGNVDGAVMFQEKALERLKREASDVSHPLFVQFGERLDRYRKAASAKVEGRRVEPH
jgi:thiol-disulfide isomerase/thioredoxin